MAKKIYWCVYHYQEPWFFTISNYRKGAIENLLDEIERTPLTWSECKKAGYSVKKITIEPVKK